jgi:UDPglucose--hexose-1-phosphate uridylyltransferase
MEPRNPYQNPHRRFNPLIRDWINSPAAVDVILVSPHRTERPWQGRLEAATCTRALTCDPSCYLCPGNQRAGGARNPKYESTFVFTNDFAALKPEVQPDVLPASQDESAPSFPRERKTPQFTAGI